MPSVATRVNAKQQQQQKVNHDGNCKLREFDVGDTVYIHNFRGTPLWIPGIVNQCCGPVFYSVKLKLNKNTLGVKKVRGQSEAALQIGMYNQKL